MSSSSPSDTTTEPSFTKRRVPADCPLVPSGFQLRETQCREIKRMLQEGPRGFHGATVAYGMGGSGKSTQAAHLLRYAPSEYDTLCCKLPALDPGTSG